MWYTLSAIGGDPDAAISLEEVVKKMRAERDQKSPHSRRRLQGLDLSVSLGAG
jgi:hypothetical protein